MPRFILNATPELFFFVLRSLCRGKGSAALATTQLPEKLSLYTSTRVRLRSPQMQTYSPRTAYVVSESQ